MTVAELRELIAAANDDAPVYLNMWPEENECYPVMETFEVEAIVHPRAVSLYGPGYFQRDIHKWKVVAVGLDDEWWLDESPSTI